MSLGHSRDFFGDGVDNPGGVWRILAAHWWPDGSAARRANHSSTSSSGRRLDMTGRYEQARSGDLVRTPPPIWRGITTGRSLHPEVSGILRYRDYCETGGLWCSRWGKDDGYKLRPDLVRIFGVAIRRNAHELIKRDEVVSEVKHRPRYFVVWKPIGQHAWTVFLS